MGLSSKVILPLIFSLILVSGIAPSAFAAAGPTASSTLNKPSSIAHIGVVTKFVPPQIHKLDNQIFNGGGPDFLNGNEMTLWTQANDFVLGQPKVVTDIHLSTVESGPWDGTATWFIYANNNGQPGALIATGSAANLVKTGLGVWPVDNTFEMFSYSFNLDNSVTLQPGTYWLGLHFAKDWSTSVGVYWVTGPTVGNLGQEDKSNLLTWLTNDLDHAFTLTGNDLPVGGMGIPIDTTALLLAGIQGSALWMIPAIVIAGAGMGFVSFRKSKKSSKKE